MLYIGDEYGLCVPLCGHGNPSLSQMYLQTMDWNSMLSGLPGNDDFYCVYLVFPFAVQNIIEKKVCLNFI